MKIGWERKPLLTLPAKTSAPHSNAFSNDRILLFSYYAAGAAS